MFTRRDRTARLLGVANLLFQHPHGLTATQIAAQIGMNVRTVYRDLRALETEVGVPFWQDGDRYGADRTSLLPPLKLTLHEAVTLFLSARLLQRFQDHRDPHAISARAAAERVMETNWHPSQHLTQQPDGSLLMALEVGGLQEITPWLLGWGGAVEVLDPPELRAAMRKHADEMAHRYQAARPT